MINNPLHQKRFSIPVTFLAVCCLLCVGMRVPDFAHSQRPKPSQRAVIESQAKASQDTINNFDGFFAIMAKPIGFQAAIPYRTKFVFAFHSSEFPPLFPNSSRAPPLSLS